MGSGGEAAEMHYNSAEMEIEIKEAGAELESVWSRDQELMTASRRFGGKTRGFAYCKDTEAAAPILDTRISYSEVAETVSSFEGFVHHNIGDAALTLEREVSYCRKLEAVVSLSDIGVSLCKKALTAAPTCLESKNVAPGRKKVTPRTLNKEESCCKIEETVSPILEKGGSYCEIKEARTPISEKGAIYCNTRGGAPPMLKQEGLVNPHTKTAACTDLGNGVLHSNIKEAAAPALENEAPSTESAALSLAAGAISHCKTRVEAVPTSETEVLGNGFSHTEPPISDKGVFYYEMGFPNVLCRPPAPIKQKNDDFRVSLYAYAIQYSVLHKGQDSIEGASPTQFVLLNHFPLNDEVAHHFSVRLNLPHQECVSAHLIPFDTICLTSEEVSLFSFLLIHLLLILLSIYPVCMPKSVREDEDL